MNDIVTIENLSRRYKHTIALDRVNLTIPRGGVFGLLGENGAGKTTLIKHILGLLRAETGTVRVFNLDPVKEPKQVLARMGVLAEDRDLPGWMKVWEFMKYTQTFYPSWDSAYAEELRETFDLDPRAKLNTLSQGQLAKAGLLAALAHRPEFLVLDEPSSGLDINVRRNILESIVTTAGDDGRTVLFSSHLLDEVERTADNIAMIREGKIVLDAPVDDIKETHQRIVIRARDRSCPAPSIPGTLSCNGSAPEWTLLCRLSLEEAKAALDNAHCEIIQVATPTLEEIFVGMTSTRDRQTLEV